jgi:exodeoxyribonuclease VII large subunit
MSEPDLLSPPPSGPPASNLPEVTVSDLAAGIRRTLEDAFGQVRVRGELSRVTIARSGHVYFDLKDDKAVIACVMWKGNFSRLDFRPEEGLEVVAEGRVSAYPGQSKYQLITDTLRPAGLGALMKLLEDRKRKLAAEGLFDAARKRPLPFLPRVIGVVTSPTGAVIRDILHRLSERFPVHVLVWPSLVQGDRAAEQIARGIAGLNALREGGPIPRPDLIIVARGGGSIEDLWPFNEEIVVRAAAGSAIPLISAVGHETDTTLIDFASDLRAPTPTAAAERAVPVRAELLSAVADLGARGLRALTRRVERQRLELRAVAARLPSPRQILGLKAQRLDLASDALTRVGREMITTRAQRLSLARQRLRPEALARDLTRRERVLAQADLRLLAALKRGVARREEALARASRRLTRQEPSRALTVASDRLDRLARRLSPAIARRLGAGVEALAARARLLDSLSFERTLERGFVLVRHADGRVASRGAGLKPGERLELAFADGTRAAVVDGQAGAPKPARAAKPEQAGLFDSSSDLR